MRDRGFLPGVTDLDGMNMYSLFSLLSVPGESLTTTGGNHAIPSNLHPSLDLGGRWNHSVLIHSSGILVEHRRVVWPAVGAHRQSVQILRREILWCRAHADQVGKVGLFPRSTFRIRGCGAI